MIKSMTGYGRAKSLLNGREIVVEIKSVNHRYFDCNIKIPRLYGYLDETVRSFVSQKILRGKVDVYLSVGTTDSDDMVVSINKQVFEQYLKTFLQIHTEYGIQNNITMQDIVNLPGAFVSIKRDVDSDILINDVREVLVLAICEIDKMRIREGEKLYVDVLNRAEVIKAIVEKIEIKSPQSVLKYSQKLEEKIKETLNGTQIDEQRMLTEVAIFADKVSVCEETVRIHSHLAQLKSMLDENIPIGRKLDFLIQELNREANTIGSKASDLEVSRFVVDLKAEIEKIREQIQNIE